MKRFNSQSLSRKAKRGHVKFEESSYVKNQDGSPKIIMKRRTNRGMWILA